MRHRVDPWSKHDPAVGAFAPIPESPGAGGVRGVRAGATDPATPQYKLWTVHLDDVDAEATELWVQAFRYRGKGRARGEFELKPARRLWVGPASLELQSGLLSAGAYRVASGLHGRIECTVHPFDVRAPVGMAVFRYISAHILLAAPELDPQVYALLARLGLRLQISSAGGSLLTWTSCRRSTACWPEAESARATAARLRAAHGGARAGRGERSTLSG